MKGKNTNFEIKKHFVDIILFIRFSANVFENYCFEIQNTYLFKTETHIVLTEFVKRQCQKHKYIHHVTN